MAAQIQVLINLYKLSRNPLLVSSQNHKKSIPCTQSLKALEAMQNSLSCITKLDGHTVEALFRYYYSIALKGGGRELENLMTKSLARFEDLFQSLEKFKRDIPLTDLLRLARQDPFYEARHVTESTAWFRIVRTCWETRLAGGLGRYKRSRKLMALEGELLEQWNISAFLGPECYTDDLSWAVFVRSVKAACSFEQLVFGKELYPLLSLIAERGKFNDEQLHQEYDGYFNNLSFFKTRLRDFEKAMAPQGRLGRKMAAARERRATAAGRGESKLSAVHKSINLQIYSILEEYFEHLGGISRILEGILSDEGGSKAVLRNFSSIGGKKHNEIRYDLKIALENLKQFMKIFQSIMVIERENTK